MDTQRWLQIEELFHRACECDPAQRARLLEESGNDDPELRRTLEELLANEGSAADDLQATVSGGLDAVAFPLVGETISHYRILAGIGTGGMGSVYCAEDLRLGRQVALKFLAEEFSRDSAALGRFEREARWASALEHPNVCPVYEFGEHAGQPFLVMPLLQGETLRELLARRTPSPLEVPELFALSLQIVAALDAAHRQGIIHRDIKPANIFVTTQGEAKILDFGLAKPAHRETAEDESRDSAGERANLRDDGFTPPLSTPQAFLSRAGFAIGTSAYMSPEQARGEKLDARTDIFSFGLVLYEMATGHRAFQGATEPILHDAVFGQNPVPAGQLNPALPARLESIIGKALEKDRVARYATAAELRAELAAAKQETEGSNAHRWWVLAAASLIVMMLVGAGVAWFSKWSARQTGPSSVQMTKLTDSGQVGDVAISPNGRYVAYAIGNEYSKAAERGWAQSLWLHELAGGHDVELLPTASGFQGLTFSHDSTAIYFVRADAHEPMFKYLYSMPALGGPARKLITDIDSPVAFSPDGTRFVYERCVPRRGDIELRVANTDGSDDHLLTVIRDASFGVVQPGPNWSPDGRTIAVPALMVKPHLRWVLGVISVANGSLRELYSSPEEIGRPVWLTRGSALLFPHFEKAAHGFQLWTVSFPKGRAQPFTHDLSDYGASLDASADGHRFVTSAGSTISEAWIVPASDPSAAKQVTSDALPMVTDIAETLDGKLLIIGRDGTVWMMNTDGSRRIRFTDVRAEVLTVCGRFVILAHGPELIRVGDDGSHPVTLARDNVTPPACSANATSVFYLTWPNKIWEVPIMGGTPRRVGDVLGDQLSSVLDVSPDGRYLAYEYTEYGPVPRGGRVVITLDGSSPLKEFAVSGNLPHNLRWSPDGKSLQFLITQNRTTSLWEQPLTGGETKQLIQFSAGQIFDFKWSSDGRRLLLMRGSTTTDAVLLNAIP